MNDEYLNPLINRPFPQDKWLDRAMKLREALKRYGWHDATCPRYPTYAEWYLKEGRVKPCDCGYDAALEGE